MAGDAADSSSIALYCRPDGYFILTMDRSTAGPWMVGGAVTVVPRDASAEDLAAATWAALAPRAAVREHPRQDQWSTRRREQQAPILHAAKVRSWAAFERGASTVSIERRGPHFTVTPDRVLGHPRGAREEMIEHRLTVEDPSALPDALRTALLLAEIMPEPTGRTRSSC